jgi:hypothetical protein
MTKPTPMPLRGPAQVLLRAETALDPLQVEGVAAAMPSPAACRRRMRRASLDKLLLARLGGALVREWNNLPMPLQRAVYEHAAAADNLSRHGAATRRRMACFLHDHKAPETPRGTPVHGQGHPTVAS